MVSKSRLTLNSIEYRKGLIKQIEVLGIHIKRPDELKTSVLERIASGGSAIVDKEFEHLKVKNPRKKKPNPAIIEARNMGFETGAQHGREQAINFFLKWIEDLESVKGIGPKTAQKLRSEFQRKYGVKEPINESN